MLGLEIKPGIAKPDEIWLCSPSARNIFSDGNSNSPCDAFLGAVLDKESVLYECGRLLDEESGDVLGERLGFMRDAYWVLGKNVIGELAKEAA